jgi:hypothetical protein
LLLLFNPYYIFKNQTRKKRRLNPKKNRFIFVPGLRLVKNDPLPATAVENTYVSRNKTRLTASPSCLAKSAFPPESCKDNFKKTPLHKKRGHKKGSVYLECLNPKAKNKHIGAEETVRLTLGEHRATLNTRF